MISCLYITAGRVLLGLILGGISGWTEGSWFDRLILRMSAVISSVPLLLSAMLMILASGYQKRGLGFCGFSLGPGLDRDLSIGAR